MSQTKHEIRIEAIYKDLMSQGLVKSQKTIDTFEKKGTKATGALSKGFDGLRGGVNRLDKSLTGATARLVGFGAAVASVGKGVQVFMRTEKAMAEVATISGDVARNISGVGDKVGDLALKFGIAESAVAKGLYQTISSGVTEPTDALETLNVALGLSVAGIADSTETTDLLVSTLNAFRDAAGGATNVADVMFSTVRQGKTTIGELAQSMSQVTPQAAALGVSMEETAAAVAAVTLSGAPTAEAVTQVRAAMTALLKKTADIDKALRERGVAGGFSLARLRSEGLLPVLRDLRTAFDGNEEGLTQLLGRVEGVNAIFNLTGENLERFQGIIDGNIKSVGAYEDALEQMGETAALKMASMMEAVNQGLAALGQAFFEGVIGDGSLAGSLDEANESAIELRDTFEDMEPALKLMGELIAWSAARAGEIATGIQAARGVDLTAEWIADLKAVDQEYSDIVDRLVEFNKVSGMPRGVDALKAYSSEVSVLRSLVRQLVDDMEETGRGSEGAYESMRSELKRLISLEEEAVDKFFDMRDAEEEAADGVHQIDLAVQGLINSMNVLAGAASAALSAVGAANSMLWTSGMTAGGSVTGSGSAGGTFTPPAGPDVPTPPPPLPPTPQQMQAGGMAEVGQAAFTTANSMLWTSGMTAGGSKSEELSEGPKGAAKAWADLSDQINDTDAQTEAFANRMIDGIAGGMTNAIMDFATGAATAEEAFGQFAASMLSDIAAMIIKQQILNAIGFMGGGLANGGVVDGGVGATTPLANGGVVQGGLIGYANGGPIVTKPHLAMVGEGHYDEAVVPLTGGREIPVQLNGGGGGAEVTFNITAMDGADVERVVTKNPAPFRMVIEEALMTNQSFRSSVRSVR